MPTETAARASPRCPLSPGPKPPDVRACSPSMAEAGSTEVVAQAVIGTPGLAGNVLPTSYIHMLNVPCSEQQSDTLAIIQEVIALGLKQSAVSCR